MKNILKIFSAFLVCLTISSCASTNSTMPARQGIDDDTDPYEGFNRAMFEFNNQVDRFVLEPAAKGYRFITPAYFRTMVSGAIKNLKEPVYSVNNFLQGKFADGFGNLGRFALNSTLGLAGTHDVSVGFGLKPAPNSLDATLASWCITDGPFLVLPLYGAATPRSFVGNMTDDLANPLFIATHHDANIKDKVMYSHMAIKAVSIREANMDLIDDFKKSSVDFYATMRSAFLQNRTKFPTCGTQANTQPNYDFDFNMDDED